MRPIAFRKPLDFTSRRNFARPFFGASLAAAFRSRIKSENGSSTGYRDAILELDHTPGQEQSPK